MYDLGGNEPGSGNYARFIHNHDGHIIFSYHGNPGFFNYSSIRGS